MAYEKERQALLAAYPGKKWEKKVADMPEDQVIAIFKRFKLQGKI